MRTYWSAIFSSAWRVKRALFALCRKIVRWGTEVRFSSKTSAPRQPAKAAELSGLNRLPISGNLSAPLEIPPPIIQRKTTKSLTGSDLSDVLNAYQIMSDWLRLGIKNEAEGYGLIPLTQGKFAIVDAEDYDRLNQYKWYASKCKNTFYACRVEGGTTIRMHREIMRAPKGLICDHIDHNGLHNRKGNLRLCTNAQNSYNQQACATGTSKYKGVCWHKCRSKWSARIRCDGKFYNLGDFDNEMEAAMAYDNKAAELFGEFAWLNFPERMELNKWIRKIIWAA
ncbi:hypothetical protein ES703_99606 [subsurface metagenome]